MAGWVRPCESMATHLNRLMTEFLGLAAHVRVRFVPKMVRGGFHGDLGDLGAWDQQRGRHREAHDGKREHDIHTLMTVVSAAVSVQW